MQEAITDLITAIQGLSEISTWQIVGAVTAAGTVAMAMLQLVKDLTPLRTAFQRRWLTNWVNEHSQSYNQSRGKTKKEVLPTASADKAQTLLIDLATGGNGMAFYELAIEQLVAQMNAAVQITLDYPKQYCDLLVVLSDGAELEDVASVISQAPEITRGKKAAPPPEFLEARVRVSHRIQRNLDAIQIALGSRWRFWMQVTALVLSTLLIEAAVIASNKFNFGTFVLAIPVGILGGYLAPVARDLVATLQTLRK